MTGALFFITPICFVRTSVSLVFVIISFTRRDIYTVSNMQDRVTVSVIQVLRPIKPFLMSIEKYESDQCFLILVSIHVDQITIIALSSYRPWIL